MIEGMTGRTWERQSLRCGYNYNNQYSGEVRVGVGDRVRVKVRYLIRCGHGYNNYGGKLRGEVGWKCGDSNL